MAGGQGSAHVSETGMERAILVIVDGMREDTARQHLGFMEGLVEDGRMLRASVVSVLPSISRVCYEAILTGTKPLDNGIVDNGIVRRSRMMSLFDALSAQGRVSAVAAYHWMSELYRRAPFDPVRDVEQDHQTTSFTHGRFYFEDTFPDRHLFAQAEMLRTKYNPALLVVHPMNTDDAGHKFGSSSKEYQASVATVDNILANLVPTWMAEGYTVLVTADHGMDENGFHGGTDDCVRRVPLYLFDPNLACTGQEADVLDQTTIADLVCRRLKVSSAESMRTFPRDTYAKWFNDAAAEDYGPTDV